MARIKQINWRFNLLAGLVIALSIFTHLYRINSTYVFQNDEGRDVLIAYKMIDQKKPVLLGPETSVGNMYLGPFYYYLMVPSLAMSHLNPVGPAIMVAIFGIITTSLIITLGSTWITPAGALIAGLISALSPIMLQYSRSSWNPNIIPFFALLLIWLYRKRTLWADLLSGVVVGILFQLHYVALTLPGLLFLLRFRALWRQHKPKQIFPYIASLIIGFILITSPFWLFESRHNWVNTKSFFVYLQSKSIGSTEPYPGFISRLTTNFKTVVVGIVGSGPVVAHPISNVIFYLASICLIATLAFSPTRLFGALILGTILTVSFLKESIYVHYLSFLYPVIALALGGLAVTKSWIRYFAIILLLSLLYLALPALKYNLTELTSVSPIRAQNVADYIARDSAGRAYNVVNSQGSYTTTISYYLAKNSNRPSNDQQNLIYDICVGGPCPSDDETTVLLFLTGPAHPALSDYLGHPQINEYSHKRHFIKNEWVTYDVWVGTLILDPM